MIQKESEENIMMLENVLETKNLKVKEIENYIESMEKEKVCKQFCGKCENILKVNDVSSIHERIHITEDVPSTLKCGSCEYECYINVHVKTKHTFSLNLKCEDCELTFNNEVELQTHMCRITVLNPTSGDYYKTNWILSKCCT